MNARVIPLHRQLQDAELADLRLFSDQFEEFWSNYQDLRDSGLDLQISLSAENGRVSANAMNLSRHRVKGFLADYRLFHDRSSERISFTKIVRLLHEACPDPELAEIIERNQKEWHSPLIPMAGWHNDFTVADILETTFNTRIFHIDDRPRYSDKTKEALALAFDENAVWWGVLLIAYNRMLCIRNINWIIGPILNGQSAVQIPTARE